LKDERGRIQTDIDSRQKEQGQLTRDLGVASFSSKGSNVFDEQMPRFSPISLGTRKDN